MASILHVTTAPAHRKHRRHDAAGAIPFVNEDVAAPIIERGVARQDSGAGFVRERLRRRHEHPLDPEAAIELRPPAYRIGAGGEDHLLGKNPALGAETSHFPARGVQPVTADPTWTTPPSCRIARASPRE